MISPEWIKSFKCDAGGRATYMITPPKLTDDDLKELDEFLDRKDGGKIPNTEALDGFFAALACCPDLVMPSEYMPVIQGGETEDGDLVFEGMDEAQRFMELVNRHWNHVNAQLHEGEVYLPLVHENEKGEYRGNDWANGFICGTHVRFDIWSDLIHDDEHGGPMVAIMALAYENHPDSDMRPFNEPVDDKKRDGLMVASAAGVMQMHAHFLSQRKDYMPESGPFVRQERKVGRNELCPCGSGKKYKKCCGNGPTLH
jgi:uncharacterized protein